jgi:chemotaxis protein CheD
MSAVSAGRRPRAHAAPAPERTVYLHPGKIYAAAGPATVTTILGSCVAVCLFDAEARVGGINHYLLPHWAGGADASARYGNVALQALLERVVSLGARPGALQAKVFGGACVLEAFRGDGGGHLGERNAELAAAFLRERGIALAASDTGGHRGRKLVFRTDDGTALVRVL